MHALVAWRPPQAVKSLRQVSRHVGNFLPSDMLLRVLIRNSPVSTLRDSAPSESDLLRNLYYRSTHSARSPANNEYIFCGNFRC